MTARYTIKRAFRDDYCLLRLTELQIYIIGLTGSDVARANAFEDEVDAEPAVSYLGINLANLQEIMLAVLVESGCEPRFYPVDVMLIHLRLHLEIAKVVDDANLLSGLNALSQFHIEQTDFARNGAADVQLLLALANQLHILLHGFQIITHLIHLRTAELCILLQSLADERMLLDGKVVIFLCLQILLARIEFFLVQRLLMLIGTALGNDILRKRQFLVAIVQAVLLHRNLGVAKHVLLFGKFTFGIQNLQVEIRIAQFHDYIALVYVGAFIHHFLQNDTAFLRTDLHHGDRNHLSIHRNIIVELRLLYGSDAQSLPVHLQGGREIAQSQPNEDCDQNRSSANPCPILARHEIFFLFYLYIHNLSY